jgi:hypothetical protein
MWFILLSVVSAQPVYKNMLRQLPNKLRQERIHATVQGYVDLIEKYILREVSLNHTFLNFSLFCTDPNQLYREYTLWNKYGYNIPEGFIREPHYTIEENRYTGQYAYQRDGQRYHFSRNQDWVKETELIYPRPYCNPKYGYELYQRIYTKLEDTPQSYTSIFFQMLNLKFPDLNLTVSDKRPSEGLYDADCCPLFTLSW